MFRMGAVNKVPNGTKLLTNKMVYKLKPDRYKARCVIRGFAQDMADVGYTFAPVCRMEPFEPCSTVQMQADGPSDRLT